MNVQMNVKKAMDKLTEWNTAGKKLKHHLPEDDEVLHSWLSQLEEFSQDLPFLLQLSSDALKVNSVCKSVLDIKTYCFLVHLWSCNMCYSSWGGYLRQFLLGMCC